MSGQTTTLRSSQLDQCLRVLDAPLAGAVGVGGGEHAESSRRVDVLLALDDQQGLSGYAARTVAIAARLNRSGIPSGLPLDHCLGGLVQHLAAETLLPRFRDVSGLGPGIASVEVLIGVADLFVRAVAADMRSRQAAL